MRRNVYQYQYRRLQCVRIIIKNPFTTDFFVSLSFQIQKMKQFIYISILSFFVISCKTAKTAESSSETLESGGKITTVNAPIADIAIAHYNLFNDFNTLRINADVDYKDQNMQQSPNAEIRIEKGKQILIFVKAFGITGAKVYLTPERASFYEILGGTYYDGRSEERRVGKECRSRRAMYQ